MQLAASNEERMATVHGIMDGLRGRMGEHPRYKRLQGEYGSTP
jgi:hypothetical protein